MTVKPSDSQACIIESLLLERVAQDAKWGPNRNLSPYVWLAILTEEVGEAAEAVLSEDYSNLREELVQVAAVAVMWLEALERMEQGVEVTPL